MPSIFKKKTASQPATPQAPPKPDITDMQIKIQKQLQLVQQQQVQARENAKKAMTSNNQVMAKQYMSQMKMYQVQEKNLTGQMLMLSQKQQQIQTVQMAQQQVSLMKELNKQTAGAETVMDEMQDVLQESMEQQRQTQQMNEMMSQFADMQLGMMDPNGELDNDLLQLQEEINVEQMQNIAAPVKPALPAAQKVAQSSPQVLDDLL